MKPSNASTHFASTYREAREKFLAACAQARLSVRSHVHPGHLGAEGEELAIDVVRIGPAASTALLVVTSGLHGVEGFCGSGCQVALLNDDPLLSRVRHGEVALVLVHAVNPYGFSHFRRVNEDSIDLNRNFLDFSKPLPVNDGYGEVHCLLLPEQWPAQPDNIAAIDAYIAQHGARRFQYVVSTGQSTHPDGLFYSGRAPAWSNTTLRDILRTEGAGCEQLAWIDIHTGLGPTGHGEKLFAGRDDTTELPRTRAIWGADVFSATTGDSVAQPVKGLATQCVYAECPDAMPMLIGLEFGTVDMMTTMQALRGEQWLTNHPEAPVQTRRQIKQALRDAFYVDTPEWRGMVIGQTRVAVLQALLALLHQAGK